MVLFLVLQGLVLRLTQDKWTKLELGLWIDLHFNLIVIVFNLLYNFPYHMKKGPEAKTSSQILSETSARKNSEDPTLVDLLSTPGLGRVQKEGARGYLYFLRQGCKTKCLSTDIKGRIT